MPPRVTITGLDGIPEVRPGDDLAALVIAAVAVREGLEAWRGETCCAPPSALLAGQDTDRLADRCCGEDGCTDGCCTSNSTAAGR